VSCPVLSCRVWIKWKEFLHRAHVKRWNLHKRQWESGRLCFARWKVFIALEKYFKKCLKKRISQKYFKFWKIYLNHHRDVKRADAFHETLKEKRILKKMFNNWKKSSILLPWDTQELR
jgi:hypothetical protein